MSDAFFFGYGSLVNRATHTYAEAHPALIRGWRRVWRHTALRPVAFLTAVQDAGSSIDGLIAGVPGNDWAVLDLREHAYDRLRVTDHVTHPLPHLPEVALYAIPDGKHGAPDRQHPILLSYIDVVVQGYMTEFGQDGVTRFFDSTDGWDAPVLDDRAAPLYPRHQSLTCQEKAFVDTHLSRVNVTVVAPQC